MILRSLGANRSHEKSVFLSYSFLSRAMRLPDEEYGAIPEEMIVEAESILNEHYTAAYGETAGSYNFHIVGSHLREIRRQGPMTQYTAYPFEGLYAELRRSFVPGTSESINQGNDLLYLLEKRMDPKIIIAFIIATFRGCLKCPIVFFSNIDTCSYFCSSLRECVKADNATYVAQEVQTIPFLLCKNETHPCGNHFQDQRRPCLQV